MAWVLLALVVALWVRLEWRLAQLARALDQVDEQVLQQFGLWGGSLSDMQAMVGDVHERAKHPHPLHGPVK